MTAIVSMTQATMAQDAARWPADQGSRTNDLSACGPDCPEGAAERLLKTGYSPHDCRGILGENRPVSHDRFGTTGLARQIWKAPTVA